MPLAEAQALSESSVFLPHDPEADVLELQTLALLVRRYSPVTGLELSHNSHCLILDITGCAHLFGGEANQTRQLAAELTEAGYFAHIATANTPGAAWAIARYGHTASDRRLRSLPVEALRIPDRLVNCLREFDLTTIGQLETLPRDSLPARFGTALTKRLDQMFGRSEELLDPVSPPDPISAAWVTEEPVCHPEAVRHVCEDLLAEILSTVRTQGRGLLRLAVTLKSETADPVCFEVRLTQPTDSSRHIMNLLNLKLETVPVPEWLSGVHMEASVTASLQIRQQSLFDNGPPTDSLDIRQLIDQLSARLGRHAVVRPRLLPEATPERAVAVEPLTNLTTASQSTDYTPETIRPLELFPEPEPVEVTLAVADGSPTGFQWNQQRYRITGVTKPERITTDWWHDTGSIRRDYYQAEVRSGSRFWLYRDETDNWFLHGVFE